MSQTKSETLTAIEKVIGLNGWSQAADADWIAKVAANAAADVAPLWPLENFVASNPYLGATHERFESAGTRLAKLGAGDVLMAAGYYADALEDGELGDDDIATAAAAYGGGYSQLTVDELIRELRRTAEARETVIPTIADIAAERHGKDYPAMIAESVSNWAAGYFDQGQSLWSSPWRDYAPFAAWRAESQLNRQIDILGPRAARALIGELPDTAAGVFAEVANSLPMLPEHYELYLPRLLATLSGWAGHARYLDWPATQAGNAAAHTIDILAIRLAWELVLLRSAPELEADWQARQQEINLEASDEAIYARRLRGIAHDALERRSRQKLIDNTFRNPATPASLPTPDSTPDLQAVFCIDVRSERLRRVIECEDAGIETRGFAGFFGLPIEVLTIDGADADAQCPVLLEPQFKVRETARTAEESATLRARTEANRQLGAAWNTFNRAAVSSFAYVESLGLAYAARLASDALGSWFGKGAKRQFAPAISALNADGEEMPLALEQRIDLAESVLRGMSLTDRFARLVALVGHGSTAVNNPYASRYHCGACGGHTGDANARLAAAILNDSQVRDALRERGIEIPATTQFVAALHDTASDEVTLLDTDLLPDSATPFVTRMQSLFDQAASTVRLSRARDHGVMDESARDILRRSQDWSEVRPEWGLVGCQAFIAAPRSKTRHVDLHGRSFLHEYDWTRDEGFAVLELIMTAPLVVASWISLQYFASTVDNDRLGSGDKTLHNVVGGIGVFEGTGGDLRVGLPWQSVHDGQRYLHQPVRLSACLAAPAEAITGILMKHDSVRQLFDNQWLHLYALEDDGRIRQYVGDYRWKDTASEVVQSLEQLQPELQREAG